MNKKQIKNVSRDYMCAVISGEVEIDSKVEKGHVWRAENQVITQKKSFYMIDDFIMTLLDVLSYGTVVDFYFVLFSYY